MEKKSRFSATRNLILSLLSKSKQPLSVFDLQKAFEMQKFLANKTTIYRELDFLKEQKLIEEFQLDDGVRRYEALSRHHHHVVCVKCKKIECVELVTELKSQEKEIEENNKFKIISHSLEFYGLCQKCQAVK